MTSRIGWPQTLRRELLSVSDLIGIVAGMSGFGNEGMDGLYCEAFCLATRPSDTDPSTRIERLL